MIVRMSSGAAERAAAAVPSSLSSSTRTMWNSPRYCCFASDATARPTTSASLRAGITATTRGGTVASAGGGSTRIRQKPPRPRSTKTQIATTAAPKIMNRHCGMAGTVPSRAMRLRGPLHPARCERESRRGRAGARPVPQGAVRRACAKAAAVQERPGSLQLPRQGS